MLQTPLNKLLVEVKSKYTDYISDISRIASLQHDASIQPTDYVTIVGKVVSIPLKIENQIREYEGFTTDGIEIGDNCIFSYRVIYDIIQKQEDGKLEFKNQFNYNGKEYFLCDITNLFAIIRGEEIIMMNGYVMVSEFMKSQIILPKYIRKSKETVKAQVLNIGKPLSHVKPISAKQYDYVHFNPMKAQEYKINGKKFCILQQSQILGKISD